MLKHLFKRLFLGLDNYRSKLYKEVFTDIVRKNAAICGKELTVNGQVKGNLSILHLGDHVNINPNAVIMGKAPIYIGNYFHCGMNMTLISSNHNYNGDKIPYDDTHIAKEIIIKDCVWLGHNVIILPGVTIGEGAIIGAGAVVSKDIPDLAIAVGNPIKIIKYRNSEHYYSLKEKGQFH